ncbi:MAG: DUF3772 domain-containing protein [Paracoccaceae bacterium]|nr:DUF3772 domain-containing protein [Paracoccaceae bacterium]
MRRAALLFWALAAFVWLCLCAAAVAQAVPDYESWDRVANTVARDLDEDRLADDGFETLRASLVSWRERFSAATESNAEEIASLEAQIAALGPVPEEGQEEAEEVADRRAELDALLAEARAPSARAEEAFARADVLIGRIDARLRERQANAYLELGPSPLAPSSWGPAWAGLNQVFRDVGVEFSENLANRAQGAALRERLAGAAFFIILAVVLITRGPGWIERLTARVERMSRRQGKVVYGFVVSLGAILLPLIGISLINLGLISTGIWGQTGQGIAVGLNLGIAAYVVSRWLGRRMFPERDGIPSPLDLDDGQRARGRRLSHSLGLLLGLALLFRVVDEVEDLEGALQSVILFPIFVLMGIALFRLAGLIILGQMTEDPDQRSGYINWLKKMIGRGLQAVAIVAPVAAAIGYLNLAVGTIIPATLTLAILAFLATLHAVVRASYGLIRGVPTERAAEALIPVLITFALTLAALPPVALVWGVRAAELGEMWTRFQAGLQLGETTVSPGDFLTVAVVFGVLYMATRLVQGVLRTSVLPRTSLDTGGQNAIVSGLGYVGITLAAVLGITAAGIDLSSLAIIIGALGVGIGFGLQNIVNNFVSGIILLIERPISEGDWIEVNGQMGTVQSISVRSTVIETFDRTDVIVPNGDFISGTVTNWTRGNSIGRAIVPVGVAYGTDTRLVERILLEIAEAHPIVAVNPAPFIYFKGFGADSLDFEIRAILTDVNYLLSVKSDMNHEIARRFAEEGIEIPFAQRDIWLRNPETLRGAPPADKEPRPPAPAPDRSLHDPDDGDAE